MKVLALVEDPHGACYRYRWKAHAAALSERGFQLEAVAWGKSWQRVKAIVAAARADIVVLQRRLLPLWQLAVLRRAARTLVYDFDDALFRRDSYSRKTQRNTIRLARFSATVRAADAVVAGNEYLRQFAASQTDGRNHADRVYCIPTCIEPDWYSPAEHRSSGAAARFVWIGQASMLPSLQAAQAQLSAAARQLGGMQLDVICSELPSLPGIDTALRKWSTSTETTDLAQGDIGISWLPDDLWSLGKCGLKVLQYMAAGLPVIANPVGIQCELVEHGRTGFLAETPDEWAQAAVTLAENPWLRRQMGQKARARVRHSFAAESWGPRLAGILDEIGMRRFAPSRHARLAPVLVAGINRADCL
jgi:hypothetical protein